jgi:hypothetical protein
MKQDTSYFTEMVTTKAGIITTTILTGMLGGYSIVGLDNTVKLKIG